MRILMILIDFSGIKRIFLGNKKIPKLWITDQKLWINHLNCGKLVLEMKRGRIYPASSIF